jgi:hypothetical protein
LTEIKNILFDTNLIGDITEKEKDISSLILKEFFFFTVWHLSVDVD